MINHKLLELFNKQYNLKTDIAELAKDFKENSSDSRNYIRYCFKDVHDITGKDYIKARIQRGSKKSLQKLKDALSYYYDLDELDKETRIFLFGPFDINKEYTPIELTLLILKDIEKRPDILTYFNGLFSNCFNRGKKVKGELVVNKLKENSNKFETPGLMYNSLCELLEKKL